ncbi:putative H4MPT-linked C1 transfer pathway protein [Methanomicrobium sp. W14]|uniref:hydantoinase/oxoprolinase family protein n=1 Tax=Methanomicrobium sp. W14 TaxID=2817839 RepID=UPI001AE15CA0|nr:hydantoinase/oxoprolinase family protein [Methanomicrobium sp. W14]MBP2132315.1 putative H4MPT-linked C1 transfer pathway protein [Methanomicrobium sp. W14]
MSDLVGIDVGGANLKVFDGNTVSIHYCPMWKKSPLKDLLKKYSGKKAAVVMSGELADGFSGKDEGIEYICNSVSEAIPKSLFYGTDGAFHEGPSHVLAAANWLASADFLRKDYPDSVLVDFGSTTTDIIPLNSFDSLKGLTDLDRLRKGYLVYTGTLRSTIPSLLRNVVVDGYDTLVSCEYFAQSADAHLVLGNIGCNDYTTPAPDGAEVSYNASLQRLSRVVCSDLYEIGESGALEIAKAFYSEQMELIKKYTEKTLRDTGSADIIAAGIGSGIISKFFGCKSLSERKDIFPDALPAFSVYEVAKRTELF